MYGKDVTELTTYMSNEEIGSLIKQKRLELKLTQAQLGERLGVGAAAVNKWEQGVVTNIKREVLRNISVELKIHPAYLIGLGFDKREFIVSDVDFSNDELDEIQNFIRYVVYKRKGVQKGFLNN